MTDRGCSVHPGKLSGIQVGPHPEKKSLLLYCYRKVKTPERERKSESNVSMNGEGSEITEELRYLCVLLDMWRDSGREEKNGITYWRKVGYMMKTLIRKVK